MGRGGHRVGSRVDSVNYAHRLLSVHASRLNGDHGHHLRSRDRNGLRGHSAELVQLIGVHSGGSEVDAVDQLDSDDEQGDVESNGDAVENEENNNNGTTDGIDVSVVCVGVRAGIASDGRDCNDEQNDNNRRERDANTKKGSKLIQKKKGHRISERKGNRRDERTTRSMVTWR